MLRSPVPLSVLLLGALALYLVGNASVALLDRDEPRYAQCSRQMLQSGDWVVPRFLNDIRAKKPPLIYWCQATCMRLLGQTPFAARLPSALAVFATACLLAAAVWKERGPHYAFWTTLVFCSSALTIVAAKSCLTDGVLLLWTVIAELCVYAIWRGNRAWWIALTLALAIALGILTKGLIVGVLLVLLLVLWVLNRIDRRRTASTPRATPAASSRWAAQAAVGVLIVVGLVGAWVYLVEQRRPGFLLAMKDEAAGHALQGKEGHGGPPGTHLLLIWADFLPWSLLLPVALVTAWTHRREPSVRFALAAVIGPWLLVELAIRTKLPHYMLPTLPPLAFLTAGAIVRAIRGERPDLSSPQLIGAAQIWAAALVGIGLIPWLAALKYRPLPWGPMALLSIVTLAWACLSVTLLKHWHTAKSMLAIGLGMMLSTAIFYGLYLPSANFLRLSILAADVLKQHGAVGPGQALMVDYKEPSLAFYQGGSIREAAHAAVVTGGQEQYWTPWMVITRDVWNDTPPSVRARLAIVARFKGMAISDAMRAVEVMVVRSDAPPNIPRANSGLGPLIPVPNGAARQAETPSP